MLPILGLFIAYMAIAWLLLLRRRNLVAVGLLVCTALIVGYTSYRGVCTAPGSCDVGGINPHFLRGTAHYFTHLVPLFAITSGLGLGAGTMVMYRRAAATVAFVPAGRSVALGIAVGIVTFFLALGVAVSMHL